MYMQRTMSGAAGSGLCTTIKYMRGAADIGLSTTIKHLRRTTSGAAGNGLGATMKYPATQNKRSREQMPEHHYHPSL
jgi:hypothetical protein